MGRTKAEAHRLDRLASGELGERPLHDLNAAGHGQKPGDVVAVKDADLHGV
jgi:hypothetical protein